MCMVGVSVCVWRGGAGAECASVGPRGDSRQQLWTLGGAGAGAEPESASRASLPTWLPSPAVAACARPPAKDPPSSGMAPSRPRLTEQAKPGLKTSRRPAWLPG